ncbi:potassium channel family protein [Streptomyces sp. NPDC096033]|uniref:potassium channel family protein n=1 Tax=Streptomyces sp. NPDC096033 TaxID=3366071 RepID=UPI003818055A
MGCGGFRWGLFGHLVRPVGTVALITWLYYLAPLDHGFGVLAVVALVGGLLLFGWLVLWQVGAIARSVHPRLQALEAVATAVPLFLTLFASTYFLLAQDRPAAFSEPLTRTDTLYFVVTVFATVGFGDIVPVDGAARVLTTLQMVADLIMVGLVAKVLLGAVQTGLSRQPERSGP